jgi:hypothetical protein
MPRKAIGLFAALLLGASALAHAHVAPSLDENNRYLKLTLLPDEVRAAYTIYFGERPGASARLRMDVSGDGVIAPDEARAFGDSLLAEVAAAVTLELDGVAVPGTSWTLADVGLGQPSVRGGSFAVDLVAHVPARGTGHHLRADDRLTLPAPGEHEIRVEESPGVRVVAAYRQGQPARLQQLRWDFRGPTLTPTERRVLVDYRVDAAAQAARPAAEPTKRRSRLAVYFALAVCGLGGVALALVSRRRAATGTGTGTSR